jgi:CO/xanthine dehydrogenase Mo-binding subunit|tara:strand:+ start:13101 stop:15326 length:2226 start_codon:yes stop_codon:yes gene_type:complete
MADRESFEHLGSRPIRQDAADKVTGQARFGADFFLPNMLVGKVLRSPYAHAHIVSIDTGSALALPGVKAVVTADDFPDLPAGGIGDIARDNLAQGKVLYHGHGVAAVAARDRATAEAAIELIKVEYEVLTPVMSIDEALAEGAPLLHDGMVPVGNEEEDARPSNICVKAELKVGDIDAGFDRADFVVEGEYTTPTVHQGYIEPASCLAKFDPDGQSTIWTCTQGHFAARDSTARILGLDSSQIKVIPAEVGGAFGGKLAIYLEAIALMLSKKSGKPVKMTMTREETFQVGGPGAATKSHIKIGATKDGKITAMQAFLAYEAGAYAGSPLGAGVRSMFTAYDVENVCIEGIGVVVNKPKVRAYRGPGVPQAAFASESLLNELAAKLGMDPIEFRLQNAIKEGMTAINGRAFNEIGLVECLRAARESPHYRSDLDAGQGRGVAVGFWGGGGNNSSASISMNFDGSAAVSTGSVDLSGTRTSIAMMAAETLGLPMERVSTNIPDTDSIGFTASSAGSRTIIATGMAVVQAAENVIETMKQRAASGWNVTVDQVSWQSGVARNVVTDEELTMREICRASPQTGGPISAHSSLNAAPGRGPTFAVHICDVEVDQDTGQTRLVRYTTVQDVGKAVHPSLVEGQMQGGAVQGIGWALNEEYVYGQDGVLQNPTFLDYRMPLASDLPMIETIIIEVPNRSHPFGVRGAGEVPIIPPLAAVGSAVADAIDAPIRALPCSPANVLRAMRHE